MTNTLKPRRLTRKILQEIGSNEVVYLLGTRQTGKTSLTKLVAENSGLSKDQIIFIDFEDLEYRQLYNDISVAKLQTLFGIEGIPYETGCLMIFDEIQLLDDPANLMKILHDHFPKVKAIATGSSSLQIKNKFSDSLAGRKRVYQVDPLNFDEFLNFKGEKRAIELRKAFKSNPENTALKSMVQRFHGYMLQLFEEYLVFGGYPEVVLLKGKEQKIEKLMSIINSYIQKDIRDIANIENIEAYNNMLMYLAVNCGSEINISSLQKIIKLSNITTLKYLSYLQETFIIKQLTPFYTNKNKEISKNKKVYFKDNGVRNLQLRNFNMPNFRTDKGELYENYVFNVLDNNKALLQELFFYRTQSQTEIDFILHENDHITLVEVKSGDFDKIPKAVNEFEHKYAEQISSFKKIIVNQSVYNITNSTWHIPAYLF